MNSVIENKIFELVTKVDNFEFAYDISERFESIKQRLWDDFWNALKRKLKSEHGEFIIEQTSDWEFIFFHRKWKIFKFYFNFDSDNVEFGVGTNNISYKNMFLEINEALNEILVDCETEISKKEFWYFINCDDDISNLQGLKRILPENREKIISEYYGLFKEMLDDIHDTVKEFEERTK